MNDRSEDAGVDEGGTVPDDRRLRRTRWGWLAGLAVPVLAAACLVGAVLATPGSPFACRLPNPGAWPLCRWSREFVANAVSIAVAACTVAISAAFLVGGPPGGARRVEAVRA